MHLHAQSGMTRCNHMDHSCQAPFHGISQARILEEVPFPSPGDLFHPGIEPVSCVPCISRWILYHWATWEALVLIHGRARDVVKESRDWRKYAATKQAIRWPLEIGEGKEIQSSLQKEHNHTDSLTSNTLLTSNNSFLKF